MQTIYARLHTHRVAWIHCVFQLPRTRGEVRARVNEQAVVVPVYAGLRPFTVYRVVVAPIYPARFVAGWVAHRVVVEEVAAATAANTIQRCCYCCRCEALGCAVVCLEDAPSAVQPGFCVVKDDLPACTHGRLHQNNRPQREMLCHGLIHL